MNVFFYSIYHIIKVKEVSFSDYISNIESSTNIILNIITIFGGVFTVLFFMNLREKQENATFNYLSRLKVRIQYLYDTMRNYKNEILDRLIPERERRPYTGSKAIFMNDIINKFADRANETFSFLMNADNQMPSSKNWSYKYSLLIEFLEDFENISNESFCKWPTGDYRKLKEDYYKTHFDNLKSMLDDIASEQHKIEIKIFGKEKNICK